MYYIIITSVIAFSLLITLESNINIIYKSIKIITELNISRLLLLLLLYYSNLILI